MIKENMVVYEALKNTVLHCEDGVRTARIYMYTVYFVVLAASFSRQWIILVSFFVLIAFQAMINSDRIAIERIASYIRVFFEDKRSDMHWSRLNKDEKHLSVYQMQYKNIGWYINNAAASILAIISVLSFVVITLDKYNINEIPPIIWVEFALSMLLCILVIYINSKVYTSSIRDKQTINILDSNIEEFYKRCCEEVNRDTKGKKCKISRL